MTAVLWLGRVPAPDWLERVRQTAVLDAIREPLAVVLDAVRAPVLAYSRSTPATWSSSPWRPWSSPAT